MLKPGQKLLLNKRLWSLRQVYPLEGRRLELEVIGASKASLGMTRRMTAILYDNDLFIDQRRAGYWQANLQHDWEAGDYGPVLQCKAATQLDLLSVHTQRPAQGNLKNQFSWSYSRGARYRHCSRAYYYHYYAAWEGWQSDAPAPVRQAYRLKNLSHIPQWIGILVHDSIKFALARLKAGQPVPIEQLIEQMHHRAKADVADSQGKRYEQKPNQLIGFQEHYYQTGLLETAWDEARAKAEQLLRAFCNSALYANLYDQPPSTFLDVETLQSFDLDGVKIWVQIDLARYTNGVIYLYDWKTGRINETELHQQLAIYALYARRTWPARAAAPIKAIVYALDDDRLLEFELGEAVLRSTKEAIKANIAHLQSRLLDSQANLAELQRFPMIDDLAICRSCQFRELCGRT